jgi:hypothetical protein
MARGSHTAPPAQPSVLVRVQAGSRLAFGVTTAALVTLASGATAVLVSQGTTSLPGASALAPNAPVTDGGVVQNAVVVDRPAGTVAALRRAAARPAAPGLPSTDVLLAAFSRPGPPATAPVTSVLLLPRRAVAVLAPAAQVPTAAPVVAPVPTAVPTALVPAVALQRVRPSSIAERAATPHHEQHLERPADASARAHGKPATAATKARHGKPAKHAVKARPSRSAKGFTLAR